MSTFHIESNLVTEHQSRVLQVTFITRAADWESEVLFVEEPRAGLLGVG